MPLDFPSNPSLNDTYSFGNKTWRWNGSAWQLASSGAINDIPIGNVTANTGNFTTLEATGFTSTGNIATGNILTDGYYYANGAPFEPGGTPGGADTNVQFNDSGAFGGSGNFTWDGTQVAVTGAVTATGNITSGNLITAGVVSGGSLDITGNIDGGNLTAVSAVTAGTIITATGNITGGNITTVGDVTTSTVTASSTITATGNIAGGNLVTAGDVDADNGVFTGDISAANISITGTFSAASLDATGNITGANLVSNNDVTTQTVTASGNVSGSNLVTAGDVTTTTVTASGNITGGNITTGGVVTATGNVAGGNLVTGGDVTTATVTASSTITATGNITGGNITTAGVVDAGSATVSTTIDATGNITGANLVTAGDVDANNGFFSGNVTASKFIGNIDAGGANTQVQFNDDDVLAGSSGLTFDKTGNLLTVAGNIDGGNITTSGVVTATGNVAGGNLVTGGDITTVTVTASGNITGANLVTAGQANIDDLVISGNVTGNLLPSANVTFDLGADTQRWRDVWLANSTIHIGNGTISANATSLVLINPDGSEFTSGGSSSSFAVSTLDFTGDGSTTEFTILSGYNANTVMVFENGVAQFPGTDYTVSGNVLTFTSAPGSGVDIQARLFTAGSAANVDLSAVDQDITPAATATYSLGNATNRWANLYLEGNTIDLGGAQIKSDSDSGAIALIPAATANVPNPTALVISVTGAVNTVETAGGALSGNAIATAAAVTPPVTEMSSQLTGNYVIGNNYNAVTAGPITINTSGEITIPSGSNWIIL